MHVAARSLAAQGLSIFGDHSDVMAVRQTGFALLASASVQEAHDLALVAQAATLRDPGAVRALLRRVPHLARAEHDRAARRRRPARARPRGAGPRAPRPRAVARSGPFIRGTAQNPDVYFQARETVNPFYARVPGDRAGRDGRLGDAHRPPLPAWSTTAGIPRPSGSRGDGLGRRDRARDRRATSAAARRAGRAWRRSGCTGRSRREELLAGAAGDRAAGRGARPHQGARIARRAAVPRRARGAQPRRTPTASASRCRA